MSSVNVFSVDIFPMVLSIKVKFKVTAFIRSCNKNGQKHFGERMVHKEVLDLKSHLVNEGNFISTIKIFNPRISHYPFQNVIFFTGITKLSTHFRTLGKEKTALVSKANLGKCHGPGMR